MGWMILASTIEIQPPLLDDRSLTAETQEMLMMMLMPNDVSNGL
jgi:hypothetical protein